jgi:hypothetical protein
MASEADISVEQAVFHALKGTFVVGELEAPTEVVVQLNEEISIRDEPVHRFVKRDLQEALVCATGFANFKISIPTPELILGILPRCLPQLKRLRLG